MGRAARAWGEQPPAGMGAAAPGRPHCPAFMASWPLGVAFVASRSSCPLHFCYFAFAAARRAARAPEGAPGLPRSRGHGRGRSGAARPAQAPVGGASRPAVRPASRALWPAGCIWGNQPAEPSAVGRFPAFRKPRFSHNPGALLGGLPDLRGNCPSSSPTGRIATRSVGPNPSRCLHGGVGPSTAETPTAPSPAGRVASSCRPVPREARGLVRL